MAQLGEEGIGSNRQFGIFLVIIIQSRGLVDQGGRLQP